MMTAIEKLQENQYKYIVSSIYAKDGIKANSFIGNHYHIYMTIKFRKKRKLIQSGIIKEIRQ